MAAFLRRARISLPSPTLLIRSSLRPFSSSSTAKAAEVADKVRKEVFRMEELSMKEVMSQMFAQDISTQIGSCMPLSNMRIGMQIHNIELRPGQGGKLVRSAGTTAKILNEPNRAVRYCEIKLPSGEKKLIDKRCRATIGTVSNPEHGKKKLRKAGHSRWLGRRPTVRGVAMNPIDHPHGGGEGKSKSSGSHGRVSVSPWGKPTKGGYKTAKLKKRAI